MAHYYTSQKKNFSRQLTEYFFTTLMQESVATVTSGANPPLIYDYYGFLPESYQLKYPAPGNPALAHKVATLLKTAGIECREDSTRGFDHGVFIPLMLTYPEADIPVVELSLVRSLDPELHLRIGEAIAPLRDENVLIVASGMSFHNMSVFMKNMGGSVHNKVDPKSVEFDNYLKMAAGADGGGKSSPSSSSVLPLEERRAMLVNWKRGPNALYAHPREEHLIPMMVAFGAAGGDLGSVVLSDGLLGAQVTSFAFGQVTPGECASAPQ